MRTGWHYENGDIYYLGNSGAMTAGWKKLPDPNDDWGEYWFYFGTNGKMVRETEKSIGGTSYIFDHEGRMLTGWNWINGRCYYLEPENGRMLSDAVTPDGYTVDGSGAWTVNGKVQVLGRDLEEGR